MPVRIGVDVGGTFTDIVCFDEEAGLVTMLKLPSSPRQPNEAVIRGTLRILEQNGLKPSAVRFFIHGTTVATNTLLQRRGAYTALLATEGFRDVLQIMRQDRPRLYDYFVQRPEPLVPRNLRFEIKERMLYTGRPYLPLLLEPAKRVVAQIKQAGILDVAVCLLHSYANPAHEQALRQLLEEEVPGVRVSISSEILPEFREFERMSTTVVNAYVLPQVAKYLRDLEEGLVQTGIGSRLHVMQSNGGLVPSATAERHCVHTILSGPAAGALSGLRLGQRAGFGDLISIDVGGTSADVAVAVDGCLHVAEESDIGGQVVRVPMIDIQTVGAGGGSIAWVDPGGALKVGPQSAGADPGPACYATGGDEPTVTDAQVSLLRLNPDYFLGGEVKIDARLARRAIQEKIAYPLGLSVEQAAEGILRVINSVMVKAIRRLSVEKGYDPRDFILVSFGGAGPLHAIDLALDLQIPRILIPPIPGASSALGLLTADFRHDYVRTMLWKSSQHQIIELENEMHTLEAAAIAQMVAEGIETHTITFLPSVDMRYVGQGFSLQASFSMEEMASWDSFQVLENRFHEQHQGSFGYSDRSAPTEIVNLRLVGVGMMPPPEFPTLTPDGSEPSGAVKGTREVYFEGGWRQVTIYERSRLNCGNRIQGPAIIEQVDSTTFFYPEQTAEIDRFGNILISIGVL
jgi:N-methylhydantoinase A